LRRDAPSVRLRADGGYGLGRLDGASALAHDDSVVEYGSITAALAILVTSLSGVLSSVGTLPTGDLKATALVSAAARSQRVSGPEARAAYAKAPYRKPVLRYLYAVGWVGAARDRAKCRAALLLGPKPSDAAAQALRRTPRLLARLRAAHLTVSQGATAIGRGFSDGCG
jgi:hypothetical protein